MQIDQVSDVLPGLLPSFYRGVEFHIADTTSEPGRRVVEYLFPGVDPAAYDDFGVAPNVISINGLIVGDDYQLRALLLQAAFERPGPGLLIHPWLGPMQVILDQPAQIGFSSRELRVARVSASLKRVQTLSGGYVGGTLGGTLFTFISAAAAVISVAATLVIAATRNKASVRSARILRESLKAIQRPQVRQFYAQLNRAATASVASPEGFAGAIASMTSTIGSASLPPAVAPSVVTPPIPADVRLSVAIALGQAMGTAIGEAPSAVDLALLASASAQFIGAAVDQSGYVEFPSRKEAFAYRSQVIEALDVIMEACEPLSETVFRSAASALGRASQDLQAGVVADINEVIGRLPQALQFRTDRPVDAWLLASHVFGDRPGRVEDAYLDIVARNRPRNPAVMEPPAIEVAR